MSRKKPSVPGLTPVRDFPYYKLQCWDESVPAWKDIQKQFESRDDLHAYALTKLDWNAKTRVMVVTGYGRRHVDRYFDAFGEPR
ncbi:MAG: hypothetical protein KKA42_08355 [candidate division Zixibacteria bacterium]|nr:hypothetical protein [candidate division Zixibacteria bacterium]